MTCQQLVELVTAYFDDALDQATREDFDRHVALCPGCLAYLEQMRTTIRLSHDLETLERQPDVTALLSEFRDWQRTSSG
jgi:anti-sigma factor RsiW